MENKKTNLALKIGLGIALALFLITGFISLNLKQEKDDIYKELSEEKEMVINNLNDMAQKYDTAMSENEINNEKLAEAKARIEGLIDSLKVSETNVKSLWSYKQKYQRLQNEMNVLLKENEILKTENSLLASSLDSTKVELEERTMFTDSLMMQNTALADVVEDASVLQTVDLKGFGVIERRSGKLIPTERARRSDKVRVCFTVAKNRLAESGDKELYVQVIDPQNNILGANEQVQFVDSDSVVKTLNYSLISKFNYENDNLNICEFVPSDEDKEFEKGNYTVHVFSEDYLLSTTGFTLK